MLLQNGLLSSWYGRCGRGTMSKLECGVEPRHRCSAKQCQVVQVYINPHYLHPLFTDGGGTGRMSLRRWALLFLKINNIPHAAIHRLLGVNHKAIEDRARCYLQSWVDAFGQQVAQGQARETTYWCCAVLQVQDPGCDAPQRHAFQKKANDPWQAEMAGAKLCSLCRRKVPDLVPCKAATQVIDRVQINHASRIGSAALRATLGWAQYKYWHRKVWFGENRCISGPHLYTCIQTKGTLSEGASNIYRFIYIYIHICWWFPSAFNPFWCTLTRPISDVSLPAKRLLQQKSYWRPLISGCSIRGRVRLRRRSPFSLLANDRLVWKPRSLWTICSGGDTRRAFRTTLQQSGRVREFWGICHVDMTCEVKVFWGPEICHQTLPICIIVHDSWIIPGSKAKELKRTSTWNRFLAIHSHIMKKQQRRDSIDRSQRSTTSSHASRWSAWCWIFWLASSEQGFLPLGRCCKETSRNACSWSPIGCDFESENGTCFIVIHMMLPSSCFSMFCMKSVNFLTICRLFHYVSFHVWS